MINIVYIYIGYVMMFILNVLGSKVDGFFKQLDIFKCLKEILKICLNIFFKRMNVMQVCI